MEILSIITFYFVVAFCVLIINAVLAGYQGMQPTLNDVMQSVFWPVSIATLLGLLIKVGVESYKEELQKPKTQQKKKEVK
jgi:hypothetical protein